MGTTIITSTPVFPMDLRKVKNRDLIFLWMLYFIAFLLLTIFYCLPFISETNLFKFLIFWLDFSSRFSRIIPVSIIQTLFDVTWNRLVFKYILASDLSIFCRKVKKRNSMFYEWFTYSRLICAYWANNGKYF